MDKKKPKAAPLTLEPLFAQLMQHTSDAVFVLDENGIIQELNSPACKMLHQPKARCLQKKFETLCEQVELSLPEPFSLTETKHFTTTIWLEQKYVHWNVEACSPNQFLLIAKKIELEEEKSPIHVDDIIALMPGHVYWMNRDGILLGCNNTQARNLGFQSREEVVGLTVAELPGFKDHPDIAEKVEQLNECVMSEGVEKIADEWSAPIGEKKSRLYHSRKTPLYDCKNNVIGMVGISFDMTETKQLETALQETKKDLKQVLSEEHHTRNMLHMLLALLPGHIYWLSAKGVVLGCNEQFARALGQSAVDMIKDHPLSDFLPHTETQQIEKINQFVLQKQELFTTEEVLNLPTLGRRVFFSQRIPLLGTHHELEGVLCVAMDITDQKNLERELSIAKQRADNTFEKIVDLMPGHIYWKDRQGRYVGCNELQAKAAGFQTKDEIIGKTASDIPLWKEHAVAIKKSDMRILNGETTDVTEEFGFELNGDKRIFLSHKGPLTDEKNNITGILGISVDITERKLTENTLNQAKEKAESTTEAKSHFIANMSHDLRTPLHALLGMAEMLKIQPYYHEQEELITNIWHAGKTLLALVEDILNFSKLEADQFYLNPQSMDLKTLIEETIATFSFQAKERGIQLEMRLDPKIPTELINDPEPLRRIFLNLLINALKFTTAGYVRISTHLEKINKQSASIAISVEDTGVGISDDNIRKIFDRFYKVAPESKDQTPYKGTGLGLAIAKQLVEALGGELQVTSQLHKGSKFSFVIAFKIPETSSEPVVAKSAAAIEMPAKESFSFSILLVEDDFLAQRVSSSILQDLGCVVDIANTGELALKKTSEKKYDVIFMDIGLPDRDGLTVTQSIRFSENLNQKTTIIALTAHASEEDAKICKAAGMNGFLVKPAMYADFKTILHGLHIPK